MINKIQFLGKIVLLSLANMGRASLLLIQATFRSPTKIRQTFPLLLTQIYSIGVFSLPIIIVSGLFIGMVVGLQGQHTLEKFGATSAIGQLVALSVLRELGPVVTALLFAGRACSALTAEIGLMKATEQLSSLEIIGVDPVGRIIAPRLWAGIISMPLLAIIFDMVAIWGGYLVAVVLLQVDSGTFWANMQNGVAFYDDVIKGIYKSIAFGIVATWVAVYQGYECTPTAEGIAKATTRTVVYASLIVLGLDFVMTAMMMGGW